MNLKLSVSAWASIAMAHLHMVQSRRDVAHQAHEEEWHLQDGIGDEVQSSYQLVVPCHRIEVDEEGGSP